MTCIPVASFCSSSTNLYSYKSSRVSFLKMTSPSVFICHSMSYSVWCQYFSWEYVYCIYKSIYCFCYYFWCISMNNFMIIIRFHYDVFYIQLNCEENVTGDWYSSSYDAVSMVYALDCELVITLRKLFIKPKILKEVQLSMIDSRDSWRERDSSPIFHSIPE